MHKEIIIAVILGSLIGLVVAFGVWKANSAFENKQKTSNVSEEKPQAALVSDISEHKISIASPADRAVVINPSATISGATRAKSVVLAIGEEEQTLSRASENGDFSFDLDLIGGLNQVGVYSFGEGSDPVSQQLILAYSNQLVEEAEKTDSLEDKVDAQIESKKQVNMFYMGTVTDVSENSFQIRTEGGEIEQVSFDEETSFANIVKTTKEIEANELAIGDFVIAMGSTLDEGNGLLVAKRVLVSVPVEQREYLVKQGEVKKIKTGILTVEINGEELNLTTNIKTSVSTFDDENTVLKSKLSNIEEGDKVILIAEKDEDEYVAIRLHVVASGD